MIRRMLKGGVAGAPKRLAAAALCAAMCLSSGLSIAAGKPTGQAASAPASKGVTKSAGKFHGGGSNASSALAAASSRKVVSSGVNQRAADKRPPLPVSAAASSTKGRGQAQSSQSAGRQRVAEPGMQTAALSAKGSAAAARKSPRTADAGSARGARWLQASFAPRIVEPARVSIGQAIGLHQVGDPLELRSSVAMVLDQQTGQTLYQKNADAVLPIASITKVMTAMVVLDAGLDPSEVIEVVEADRDTERFSGSRLPIGSRLSRSELMHLALMSSENRAAHALGRTYPGGLKVFVDAMNTKARTIGMEDSRFSDPTGLSSGNVSNARDLARMVRAAHAYSQIRRFSTATDLTVDLGPRQAIFRSTNRLVDDPGWEIGLQKTGYISEAGKCLVMQAKVDSRSVIIVLLDAAGSQSRFADAQRLRKWLLERPPEVIQRNAQLGDRS